MVRVYKNRQETLAPPDTPEEFLKSLKAEEEANKIAEVGFDVILNKDSTNIVPADWTHMAEQVHRRMNDYDGFVIAHGTDTMHFSSTALALAFGKNLRKPIVFTGAQTTPDVSHGDARVNLLRALKVACEDIAEVVVVFGEFVFRGSRVQKKDERRFDAFDSPAEFPLGYVTEDIVLSDFVRRRKDVSDKIDLQKNFAGGIAQISLIPGLEPELIAPILDNPDCRGVVLQSFGAGNVPNEEGFGFLSFIKQASERSIPVIIASQFPANSTLATQYEPGIAAQKAGAIGTGNMTNAAATVKFRWVLHQVQKRIDNTELKGCDKIPEIRRMMNKSFVNELTEIKGNRIHNRSKWDN